MNTKGFAQIVVLVAIVLGIAVLGGGGYLISQKTTEDKEIQNASTTEEHIQEALPADDAPLDVCANIEGTQTEVPENMEEDTEGNCVAKVVVVEKEIIKEVAVEVPIVVPPPEPEPVPEVEETRIPISVEIITANSFGTTGGVDQSPLTVGYKFTNKSDTDVAVDKMSFRMKVYGVNKDEVNNFHYIHRGETLYSVSDTAGSKENAVYIEDIHFIDHSLSSSITIPANSSKTIYLNMWNFAGDLDPSFLEKGTRISLESVKFVHDNIDLSFIGSTIADIDHHK